MLAQSQRGEQLARPSGVMAAAARPSGSSFVIPQKPFRASQEKASKQCELTRPAQRCSEQLGTTQILYKSLGECRLRMTIRGSNLGCIGWGGRMGKGLGGRNEFHWVTRGKQLHERLDRMG